MHLSASADERGRKHGMRGKAVTFRPHTALRFGGPEFAEPNVEEKLKVLPREKTKTPLAVPAFRELLGEVAREQR